MLMHTLWIAAVLFPMALLPGMTAIGDPVSGFFLWSNLGVHFFTMAFSLVDFCLGRYGFPGCPHLIFPLGLAALYVAYAFFQKAVTDFFP
jgi:hypothetical protein